ncbi:hypothetical protein G7021_19230 [Pseudomonas carnis]|uniref:hypothetical protein n=1 Tax=Pseudomonas TaxID=286 RepID=UPI00036A299D|nr:MULTISPECIES: hypothetical protein [Pseudomonas]MBA1254790.1 hypothetical protein [Pseudomonas carnis]MBC3205423.1 hypothetical protein [Pseudomonas sp. SWRI111]MBP0942736.1 hypothetical protein [Pseudomonas alliivorans]MEE4880830.1 hypothetical protein [Pseudomonas alliivorans]MEE4932307.1 hypothetical protein [Pseudomonas alliivorans]
MSRPHTYVEIRELQFLLTRLADEAHRLEASDSNYQLDLEFSKELDQLIQRYGYSDDEALRLIEIVSFYESEEGSELRKLIGEKSECREDLSVTGSTKAEPA